MQQRLRLARLQSFHAFGEKCQGAKTQIGKKKQLVSKSQGYVHFPIVTRRANPCIMEYVYSSLHIDIC